MDLHCEETIMNPWVERSHAPESGEDGIVKPPSTPFSIITFWPTFYEPFHYENIVIEGNIGSGKSWLMKTLAGLSNSYDDFALEPVSEWQNYHGKNMLDLLHSDKTMTDVAFKFQLMALLTFSRRDYVRKRFAERSIDSAWRVFTKALADRKQLDEFEQNIIKDYYKYMRECAVIRRSANLVIYVRASPQTCLERIKDRDGPGDRDITLEYLQKIHDLHEKWLMKRQFKRPVLVVDNDQSLDKIQVEQLAKALNGQISVWDLAHE